MITSKQWALIVLVCISVGILLLDRSFFKEFMALRKDDHWASSSSPSLWKDTTFSFTNESVSLTSTTVSSTNATIPSNIPNDDDHPGPKDVVHTGFNRTDWFDKKLWQDSCIEVNHICHSTGRWWYQQGISGAKQPNFTFMAHTQFGAKIGYPRIEVRPATDLVRNMSCPYSPQPNHLVLFSMYNEMLGEFYVRISIGLAYILEHEDDLAEFLLSTQMYLHLYDFDRRLLESHHAFMAPFLSHNLLDFKVLLQSTSCSCLERLVLCGYEFQRPANSTEIVVRGGAGFDVRKYGGNIAFGKYDPEVFAAARNKVREKVILNNPFVQQDMQAYRLSVLQANGVRDSFDEWKIVGFAQRTGRRKWLNLDQAMRMCESNLRRKRILCITVNVEDPQFHPTHHAVVHGVLDALIGIHGAQLTEAIWMKPGAVIAEILTYLPEGVRLGSWTRSVRSPTPLGIIFLGSDLYHVGLPLKADSVPQCNGQKGEEFRECVRRIQWDRRDFNVNAQDVIDIISSFVDDRPASCDEQKRLAGDYRFVLYSVHCDDGKGMALHNFYWNKSLESLEKYSGVPH